MVRRDVFVVIVLVFISLMVVVQDVQAAETYDYGTQWGPAGTGNGLGKMPRNNFFDRWCKYCSGL